MTRHRLSFLLADASDVEKVARLREMRVIIGLLCGWGHPGEDRDRQGAGGRACCGSH
jgi:hypothetical protein